MTLVMTSLPLAHVFQCLFTTFISTLRWLAEIWKLSCWKVTEELEMEFKYCQRRSCKLSFLFPPCYQSAPELARRLIVLNREHEVSAASFSYMWILACEVSISGEQVLLSESQVFDYFLLAYRECFLVVVQINEVSTCVIPPQKQNLITK